MNGDVLTVTVGAAGVVASIICSSLAFRRGAQQADSQKAELLLEIQEVRGVLSSFARGVARLRTPLPIPGRAVGDRHIPQVADPDDDAVDLLVRASLGALLDERGEVRVQRLLDEVSSALGTPDHEVTVAALGRLRDVGSIDWDGDDDLMGVQVICVRTPGAPGRHRTAR